MPYLSIFLLSFSSLSFEIMLARFFLISQWNHMSFMVISIALLGYAASGRVSHRTAQKELDNILLITYSTVAVLIYFFLNLIPIDFFRILTDRVQLLYLLITYIILAIPFFITGLAISRAYSFQPGKSGKIYLANMGGSATGVALPFLLLGTLNEGEIFLISALIPLIAVFVKSDKKYHSPFMYSYKKPKFCLYNFLYKITGTAIIIVSLFIFYTNYANLASFRVSQYKILSQILKFPNTKIIKQTVNIRERADLVESPYIRFAPGLSLSYTKPIIGGKALILNGDTIFSLHHILFPKSVPAFPSYTLSFVGYILLTGREKPINKALIIERGGGLALLSAILEKNRGELKKADVVVNSKELYKTLLTLHKQNSSYISHGEKSKWINIIYDNPRAHVQNLVNLINPNFQKPSFSQSKNQPGYDLIQIENWGSSVPGMASTTEEFLFTVNAILSYLKILNTNGILTISRKLILPPSDSLRIFLTALKALSTTVTDNPQNHIVALRNWDTYTIIVSKKPINMADISRLKLFTQRMSFDFIYYPGIRYEETNKFNIYKKPFFYNTFNSFLKILSSESKNTQKAKYIFPNRLKKYLKNYYLDVAPQSDARPFQNKFIKLTRVFKYFKSTGNRPYKLLMSGEVIVAVVFMEGLILAAFILFIPLSDRKKPGQPTLFIYFSLLGCGFMFIEMAFIKTLTLIIDNSIISFSIVLFTVLIFSGIGGKLSDTLRVKRYPLLNILSLLFLLIFFLEYQKIIQNLLSLSKLWRLGVSLLPFILISLTIGLPFPLGIRYLTSTKDERSYAWTINGTISVLATVVSEYITFSLGIDKLLLLGLLSYTGILLIWLLLLYRRSSISLH